MQRLSRFPSPHDLRFDRVQYYDPEVYRNERLRGRPLVNSLWELTINQSDEMVNQDINLESVSDIIIRLYYTDYTEL